MIAALLFACVVTGAHDGDGPIYCADGTKVRVAGVQAPDYESAEPCHQHRAEYVCDDIAADRSRRILLGLVTGQTLQCRQVDMSYARTVATCTLPDGRDLSCALIAAGSATRWDRYWRRYRLRACPR